MARRKLSIALEEDVAIEATSAAARRGVSLSAWLNEASRRALALEDGLAAVAEWEAEHGHFSDSELADTDAMLDSLGVRRLR